MNDAEVRLFSWKWSYEKLMSIEYLNSFAQGGSVDYADLENIKEDYFSPVEAPKLVTSDERLVLLEAYILDGSEENLQAISDIVELVGLRKSQLNDWEKEVEEFQPIRDENFSNVSNYILNIGYGVDSDRYIPLETGEDYGTPIDYGDKEPLEWWRDYAKERVEYYETLV